MGRYSSLDVLMKEHEHKFRRRLDPTDYILIRLDGRSFSTFTRGLNRPYDLRLMHCMTETTKALCEQIQGVRMAYTQSDEISLLLTSWKDAEVEKLDPAFGGVEAKLLSLSASIATAEFNRQWAKIDPDSKLAHFDSRVWTFPGTVEGQALTRKYFEWRRSDATRNSVSMAAQTHFSHRQLHKVNTFQMKAMLTEIGEPWEDLLDSFRFGTLVLRTPFTSTVTHHNKFTGQSEEVSVNRNRWELYPATEMDYSFIPDPLQG